MEFIDKTNANLLLDSYNKFENEAWNSDESTYHYYAYIRLPRDVKRILIEEQKFICCYCMAKLEESSTTLEHIYPQNPIQGDSLANYNINCIDTNNFEYSRRNLVESDLTNLPHDISYYNLVASCDSKISCNNKRQNKIIKPFVFNSNVHDEFMYNDNGDIFSLNYSQDISVLGLSNEELIKCRKLWKFLKNNNVALDLENKDNLKIQLVTNALIIGKEDSYYRQFAEVNSRKVNKALRYAYFYS